MNTTPPTNDTQPNGAIPKTKGSLMTWLRSNHAITALFILVFVTFFFNGCTAGGDYGAGSPIHSLGFPLTYFTVGGSEPSFNPVSLLMNTILFFIVAWFRKPLFSIPLVSRPLFPLVTVWFMLNTLPGLLFTYMTLFWMMFILYNANAILLIPVSALGIDVSVPSSNMAIGAQAFLFYYVLTVALAFAVQRLFLRAKAANPSAK